MDKLKLEQATFRKHLTDEIEEKVAYVKNYTSIYTEFFDKHNNEIYGESANGYGRKWEFDDEGDMIYGEDSGGERGGIKKEEKKEVNVEMKERLIKEWLKSKEVDEKYHVYFDKVILKGYSDGSISINPSCITETDKEGGKADYKGMGTSSKTIIMELVERLESQSAVTNKLREE